MDKFAFFILNLNKGGAERVVSNLCNSLINKREVILIVLDLDINYYVDERVKIIKLCSLGDVKSGILKLVLIPYYAYQLSLVIKKEKVTKLFAYLLRPNFIAVISRLFYNKCKLAISERSNPVEQYSSSSFGDVLNRFLIKRLYPFADVITVNSYGSFFALKNFYKIKQKIEVIYNPISPKFFLDNSLERNEEVFKFISIGRLDEGKNHLLLLNAVKLMISSNVRNFQLAIVGDGPLKASLQDFSSINGLNDFVIFLGHRSDIEELLFQSHCSVLTSNREGFPNVVLESIAAKNVVISADCPFGPREILTNQNVLPRENMTDIEVFNRGVLFPMNDELSLFKAMIYVIDNYKEFELSAEKQYLSKFSLEHITKKIEKLL